MKRAIWWLVTLPAYFVCVLVSAVWLVPALTWGVVRYLRGIRPWGEAISVWYAPFLFWVRIVEDLDNWADT